MQIKLLHLSEINVRSGTQTRAHIRDDVVEDYAEIYKSDPDKLPPLIVFVGGSDRLLADGFHRFYGAQKAGLKTIKCEVRSGDFTDALAFSLTANVSHGLRRTNEDKRRSVELALAEWPNSSDRQIAISCSVHHELVGTVRATLTAQKNHEPDKSSDTLGGGSANNKSQSETTNSNTQSEQPINTAIPFNEESKPNSSSMANHEPQNGVSGQSQPKEPRPNDETGTPIPDEAQSAWNRRQEIQDLMSIVSGVKSKIRAAKDAEDTLFGTMSNAVLDELSLLHFQLADLKPYAVCSQCMGTPSFQPTGCSLCGNSGMISKKKWDTVTRKEVKDLRAKANSQRK